VNTIDVKRSKQRDEVAAAAYFKPAIDNNGAHEKVVIDQSASNKATSTAYFPSPFFDVTSTCLRSNI
jgi:transposase-like protein